QAGRQRTCCSSRTILPPVAFSTSALIRSKPASSYRLPTVSFALMTDFLFFCLFLLCSAQQESHLMFRAKRGVERMTDAPVILHGSVAEWLGQLTAQTYPYKV